ncbi:MAG: hypothetical protein ACR2F6_14135 [Mycobacteriales bacterium]
MTSDGTELAPLTQVEASDLDRCEQIIDAGMTTFIEVGEALWRIRDGRLYRTTYATFEEYCHQRWGWTRGRSNQLIRAAEVVHGVDTTASPPNERQARELVGLPPETAQEVWQAVVDDTGGRPTAAAVRDAREQVAPKPTTNRSAKVDAVRAYFATVKELREVIAVGGVSEDAFEAALAAARADGDLSRENVVSHLKPAVREACPGWRRRSCTTRRASTWSSPAAPGRTRS